MLKQQHSNEQELARASHETSLEVMLPRTQAPSALALLDETVESYGANPVDATARSHFGLSGSDCLAGEWRGTAAEPE